MFRKCSSNGGRIEDGELVSHVARQLASGVGESCAATGSDIWSPDHFLHTPLLEEIIT